MPTLYVTATPIGNLEDITLRALRVLREVKLIAAEDTRRTKHLLSTYNIDTPLTSYHEFNKWTKLDYMLRQLQTGDMALVSNAGMPGISDPGHELIVAASERGIPVVPVPGASTVITALAVSGLPTDRFVFLGFLSRKESERRRVLESVAAEPGTIVILESPYRLLKSLHDILLVMGDRRIAVCRELTKIHEEVFRGTVSQAIARFAEPRGEFTIVVEGKGDEGRVELSEDILQEMKSLRLAGATAKDAVARLAKGTGVPKNELYQAWVRLD